LDNTDAQDLSLVGDVLTLSGDPNAGVDLDAYLTTNNYVDESYLTTNNYITTAEVNDLAETVAITAGTCSGKVVQSNGTTWSCVTPGSGADGISATAALSINGSNLQLTDGTNTTSVALSLIDTDTTYTAGTGLTLTGTVFSNDLGATIESAEITDGTIAFGDLATALVLDEDTLVSNSATALATQQSIKAYVDAKVDNDTTYSAGTNKGILFTGTTVGLIETCTNGDVLAWNSTGGTWDCAADGGATYTAGTGLTLTGTVFSNDLGATIESAEITDGTIAFGDLATALVLDEDTLVSNSATALATQQSIKAYVDAKADNDTTYTAGTGLTLTGTVFSNDLGAAIETGEITNGTVLLEDLDATAYETTTVDSTTNGDDLVTEAAVEAYLTANDSDTTYSAGINKGILFTGTTVGLIETCANGEVLSWSSGGSTWGCTTIPSGADNMGNGNATTAITLRDVGPDTNNWSIDEQSDEDFEFAYNGTEKIRIDTSGNLYATGYIQTSDVRFKENISTVHGLDVVSQLRGVSFDWKNSGESTLGVIAQEVESVVPELVRTDEDGYKGVNYDGFAAVLIEAIKELKLQNETLQQRVEALEASAQ
ncbi:MAG TPA: tail fiber domain-containing protein, partial [Candidatus Gracilibacteria bacterium]